ncbi:sigma-54-dependent Fis family transcriptional regulator [Antrihabitans sp. YC2-6]|uniref:sigma-54-dependent Fis family transcriptional regulator n=1 Tax=Antrihabitans sp. YC2-6 TaxID=2799498 RepID=UPI0018F5F380|nr:helix-turn-helix domain-containing protein [Antrihabitans sp. YC2-6]MBJ8348022.1 Fis family transcriptional regulator [Antrihabitans sp. YC2-6]
MSGQQPLRPEIALSWQRSMQNGVDPGSPVATDPVPELDRADRLLRAAQPVLDEVAEQIAGTGFCVLLVDRDCRTVARLFDGNAVERHMERIGAVLGARFGEDEVGTTALGTPLEVGKAIVVNGAEHFLERFKDLSCYGHPIVHPVTRRVEGILDMTGIASQANPLFAPFLARAAKDIERRILEGSRISQQRLVDAFQRVLPQRNLAVAAISEDMLLSNRVAHDLLDATDHAALRDLAADLRSDQSRTVDLLLASGEPAHVRIDRVAGAEGGALFQVLATDRTRTPIARKADVSRPVGDRIAVALRALRDSREPVAISGEPGTGRTAAVRDLAGAEPLRTVDAIGIALHGVDEWVRALCELVRDDRGVLAIENVQLVAESTLPLLTELVSSPAGPRIVLTSNAIDDLPIATAALVGRCPGRVQLPALRQRTGELAEIVQNMLDGIEPGVRLTPSALEALVAAEWPGNLSELAVVLRTAFAARSSNRIDVTDLPEAYRTSARVRRLAGRERAERQAIADALHECGGNKVHAAAKLGISRSTLYTRMRALDVRNLNS